MKFEKWFSEQHCNRPSKKGLHILIEDRDTKVMFSDEARRLVNACNIWDEQRKSALYAWNLQAEDKR